MAKATQNQKVNPKNDLTEGPIFGKLIGFAIPVILGNLCFQLYNVVDSIVVGNYVGTDALAAVGAVFPIMMLFNALFMGVSMGAQIVISQTFGAKDEDSAIRLDSTKFDKNFFVRRAIMNGRTYASVLRQITPDGSPAGKQTRKQRAAQLSATSFYIPEDLSFRADNMFSKRGTGVGSAIFGVLIFVIVAAVCLLVVPAIVEMFSSFIS